LPKQRREKKLIQRARAVFFIRKGGEIKIVFIYLLSGKMQSQMQRRKSLFSVGKMDMMEV
jgi:hypothetical protein